MGRVFSLITTLSGTADSPRFNLSLRAELESLTRLRSPVSAALYSLFGDATSSLDLSVGTGIANEWETAHIDALKLYADGYLQMLLVRLKKFPKQNKLGNCNSNGCTKLDC